ncbi:MAG: hypothetical protein ACYTFQ_04425 [Planctomycetota bacterium]|jgi:hypothetical protein
MIKTSFCVNLCALPGELAITALILTSPGARYAPPFEMGMYCAAAVFFSLNCVIALIYTETK